MPAAFAEQPKRLRVRQPRAGLIHRYRQCRARLRHGAGQYGQSAGAGFGQRGRIGPQTHFEHGAVNHGGGPTLNVARLFGALSAAAMLVLGALATYRARSAAETTAAWSSLGTLMTVVTGLLSALWWHQSASLSEQFTGSHTTEGVQQKNAAVLNGAAATATGLALIAGVFSNLSWTSPEGVLAGFAFLMLLAMSGSEMWDAAVLSVRQGLHARSMFVCLMLIMAGLLFIVRWLVF